MELFQRLTTVIHSQCHSLTQSTAQTICFVSLALKSLGAGMSGYLVVVQFDQIIRTYSLRKVSRQGSRVCQFPGPRLSRNRQEKARLCPWPVEPEFRHLGTSDLRRKISSQASESSELDGKNQSLQTGHWPAGRPGRV